MAEEKLGTLAYDMIVSDEKLKKSLDDITAQIQAKEKVWNEAFKNVGAGGTIDVSKIVAANKTTAQSTEQIKSKISELRAELKKNIAAYEEMGVAARKSNGGSDALGVIQKQKDQLVQLAQVYRQTTSDNKKAAADKIRALKDEETALRSIEAQRSKAFVKTNIDKERELTAEFKKQEASLRSLEAQRSKAFVQGNISKEKELTAEIKRQESAMRSLEAQRSKAYVSSGNKDLKDREAALKRLNAANLTTQKLQASVDANAAGSIGRLRAELALLVHQLNQVGKTTPKSTAELQRLTQAIAANKNAQMAMAPTLGMWGKLISAIKTYATAYLSVQAVMGLGRAVYTQTKELDQLAFGMKTVIKSSVELANTQKFLSEVAINYGGDLLTLSERYIKFRAAAQQSNMSAAETQKIFDSMSKAAGTLGLKTDELSGVYLALEQMISKGKVTTEELRRQLGERLPGAFGIMANALGVTIPQLDKMLKKGEVLSKDALPKFANAIEKAYGIESLKKIDTLAAAQGRMSTEFTGLIGAMEASGSFKNIINGIASSIGFVKDNIAVFGFLAKILAVVGVAYATNKAIMGLHSIAMRVGIGLQNLHIAATGKQAIMLPKLTASVLAETIATNQANAATSRWSTTFKTFGGWVSILINVLLSAAAAWMIFKDGATEAQIATKTFEQNVIEQNAKLATLYNSVTKAAKSSNEYKDALFEINNVYGKYLPNLLTERSSVDEVTKARALSITGLKDELNLKERLSRLEVTDNNTNQLNKKTIGSIANLTPNLDIYQKQTLLSMIKDMGDSGVNEVEKQGSRINNQLLFWVKEMDIPKDEKIGVFTSLTAQLRNITNDVIETSKKIKDEIKSINLLYPEQKGSAVNILNLDELKAAEEEFKKLEELQKVNGQLANPNYSEDFKTFKAYLLAKRKEFSSSLKSDYEAREAIDLKLAELEKDKPSDKARERIAEQRAEALKKLNEKYLSDQEEFANFEAGISAGRIAELEDGIEKERKLNELAYENRLKAIEKQKIASLALLNDAAGFKVGSKNEITGFNATSSNPEIQAAIDKAGASDNQARLNNEQVFREANLKSEKDYQIKINELRRDANDQFLTGLEKERAAINEKYDEWVRKAGDNMKLIAEIEHGRGAALDTIYRQNELDQLDFKREIEYKKNEIVNFGAAKQRKLEKANFESYAKYEREKIKLLKADKSTLQQGIDAESALVLDEKLFKLKQEQELRDKILDGIKQVTDELIKQMGLSDKEAEKLTGAVNILTSAAKGDYFSAAISAFSLISESLGIFANGNGSNAMLEFYTQLGTKITDIVNKVSLLNSTLSKIGDTSSIAGIRMLQAEMVKLKNDAARLNKELAITASSGGGRRGDTSADPNNPDGGGDGKDRIRMIASMMSQVEYLNEQILILSNKLLDPNLTEEQRLSVEALLNGYIDLVDAIDSSIQNITGTSINELSNSIVDAFLNGEDAAVAWGDKVNDIIKYMIKQQLISQLLTKPITEAIQTLVTDSENGLSPEEAAKFKATIKGITEDVAPAIKDAVDGLRDVGIDIAGSSTDSANGISKSIQALTEDTGRRLEGLINSIRETGVINMGNVAKLVESAQITNSYASESLGVLRSIDKTTASQLTLFNEIMTSASGVGGKGMKVYIQ